MNNLEKDDDMARHSHHYEHMLPELGDTSHLTARQRDVVDLMRKGLNDREIAEALGLSLDTVKCHVEALRHRFDAVGDPPSLRRSGRGRCRQ